ncbi:MAG TPA: hypothetical protein VIY30_17540 [Burkholderiaceae bacterium]
MVQGWQTPYLGQREIPRELSQFELQAFFSFSAVEHELIARHAATAASWAWRRTSASCA